MRAFIAVELPKEIGQKLALLQEELKKQNADVKWVEAKNIHLTLKFLGEIEDEIVDSLYEIMQEVAKDKKAFSLRICSMGAFPKTEAPRVIWVGIDRGDKEIKEIAKELEEKIYKIGVAKEKRDFSSHITIARVRSSLNRIKLIEALKVLKSKMCENNLEFTVNKITLLKSTLTPKGPIYEALKEIIFKTA